MEKLILSKLNEIKLDIQSKLDSYDLNQINELLIKLDNDIKLCVKISIELLEFYKDKVNFRTIADLRNFSLGKLNYKVKSTRRVDIELELARVSTVKNLNSEQIKNLLGKPIKKVETPVKRRAPKKPQPVKIKDQTSWWLGLSTIQLKSELNNLKRYPDYKALKQAAYSILKPNEKRFRLREKIINAILERISEEKALAHLGR